MNFFSIDTLFLVSIFDYNILQILYIETFPSNASYFPNNACLSLNELVCPSSINLFISVFHDLGRAGILSAAIGRLQ